jgi:hypothetical protein
LESDFGKHQNRYIPQILSKLNRREFWSSSGNPNFAESALVFDGNYGVVRSFNRNINYQVRCGCGGAGAWQNWIDLFIFKELTKLNGNDHWKSHIELPECDELPSNRCNSNSGTLCDLTVRQFLP